MTELYIGLMSGTSVDGVDAALVDLSNSKPKLVATHYSRFPDEIRQGILHLCHPGPDEINRLGELDSILGNYFANTVLSLLQENKIDPKKIRAIGSHGQTIRHHPTQQHPFSLQIGDPNIIAAKTGITTVADFRRRDMALGGQGAPLVPAFHQHIFATNSHHRVIVNIGGIANITLLSADKNHSVMGYDTGPGNTLLDAMAEKYLQKSYDEMGAFSAQGKIQTSLLENLLKDPYFALPYPKSTGREYFNLEWLQPHLSTALTPADIQATLVELTAKTILDAIQHHFEEADIFVCGGGAHNAYLMSRLKALVPVYTIESTQQFGIDPNWVEAMAFAWLAQRTLHKQAGNIPTVTGAKEASILGGVYYGG